MPTINKLLRDYILPGALRHAKLQFREGFSRQRSVEGRRDLCSDTLYMDSTPVSESFQGLYEKMR